MDIIERFIDRAKSRNLRLVLPEGNDERIILAARRLNDDGIANAIVLGQPDELKAVAARADVSLEGLTTSAPEESDKLDVYAEMYASARPSANIKVARRMMRKPLFYGGMMVKAGDAHAMIAGVASTTSRV
ncbi:MAG: phosphate acyltransferase, partial [Acidiferrobacterales bacterium]